MRITIPLINLSWHGGVRVLVELANHLSRAGHKVEILVARGYVTGHYLPAPGVELRHLGFHTGRKAFDYLLFLLLIPFAAKRGSVLIANFFVTYYPVRIAAWLKGSRHLYLVQDIESKYRSLPGRLLNAICRRTYRDPDIVTVNQKLQLRLQAEFKADCRSVDIGPAEVFFETESATAAAPRYDIAFFARREPWKGLDRLYALLDGGPIPGRLICITQDQKLRAELRARGLDCVSPADDAELIRILDDSRLLLFTSHDEGFGLPPLEAMARGIPVVLYPCGGPDLYVVNEWNAVYVHGVEDCRRRLEQVLTDPDFHQRLGAAARQTAERFRMRFALEAIQSFIEQPAARHAGSERWRA